MLVHLEALDAGKIHPRPRIKHGSGQRRCLLVIHPLQDNGHKEGRHLIIRNIPFDIAVDEKIKLIFCKLKAVLLLFYNISENHL